MADSHDWQWMQRALELAERGRGYVEPNPLVLAVVVQANWAMRLDGKTSEAAGDSKGSSTDPLRQYVHRFRGRMEAIVVGTGPVLASAPLLTARPPGPRTPLRVVLDSRGRLPVTSQLARTAGETPVLVATAQAAGLQGSKLNTLGCEVLPLPEGNRRPSVTALLDELGPR